MAEITIKFDLTFSRRFITAAGAAAMMLCAVPELESESVTLSTYYPAPSGVYTNMITTGNTYLARDLIMPGSIESRVGIGTAAPGAKLDVIGESRTQFLTTTGANPITSAGALAPYTADIVIGSDRGVRHDSSIMMWSAASALRLFSSADVLYVNTWNQAAGTYNVALGAAVGAKSTFGGPVEASGAIQTRQGLSGPCTDVSYTYLAAGGGSVNLCAGQYITLIDGIYSKKTIIPGAGNDLNADKAGATFFPQVVARCCPCPAGGCAGM